MTGLEELIRQKDPLGELEVEELAGYVLEHLNAMPADDQDKVNLQNLSSGLVQHLRPDDYASHGPIVRIVAEAWSWLTAQGLLTQHPDQPAGWFFVSRRGKKLKTRQDVATFRQAGMLQRDRLHPDIAAAAWGDFVRGNYEPAVFASFKEVEVAVRKKGGYADTDYGTELMRKAFQVPGGPLTDSSLPKGEQEAMGHLFAGSIGFLKNPSSHRHVDFSDPGEAAELIGFASYLRRLVE